MQVVNKKYDLKKLADHIEDTYDVHLMVYEAIKQEAMYELPFDDDVVALGKLGYTSSSNIQGMNEHRNRMFQADDISKQIIINNLRMVADEMEKELLEEVENREGYDYINPPKPKNDPMDEWTSFLNK